MPVPSTRLIRLPLQISVFALLLLPLKVTSQTSQPQSKPPAAPAKKPAAAAQPVQAPPAPQSKHYPILLIASGTEPSWSARIGMKGAERLERLNYPPIVLEPGGIDQDGTADAWLYHAKDTATSAEVTIRLSREACSDNMSDTKYSFRATVNHAQIGELKGCAKIAPEQFPEFKQKNLDDDDPDKKKIVPPAVTFKPPVAVAYLDPTGRVMLARGEAAKVVAPKGSQLSLSRDGKRLLFTRDDAGERAIALYDATTQRTTDLQKGQVQSAFWSPDDSQIAFLKQTDQGWRVWTMPAGAPDRAAQLANVPVLALQGWADIHTVVATDATQLHLLKTESPPASLDLHEIYGPALQAGAGDTIRVSPMNPDLVVLTGTGGSTSSVVIVELKSKRRMILNSSNSGMTGAEWSRDGVQIYYTGRDTAKSSYIYRILWDGSSLKRIRAGSDLVVGQ